MTDDARFLERFEASAIPASEWDHAAHARVAFLHLRREAYPAAVQRIRSGIRRLNRAQGVAESDRSGYHETLTLGWARLVVARIRSGGDAPDFGAFIRAHRELLEADAILEHDSPARLGSPRARREFVLPDRKPLPAIGGSGAAGAADVGASRPPFRCRS